MNIANRIERMFGRTPSDDSAQSQPPGNLPEFITEQPATACRQWYDSNPDLFNSEKESLEANGFTADCTTLPDARVCFTAIIAGKTTALICGYLHPLEPVTVQMLEDIDAPGVADEMGKVDLFAHDGFRWSVEVRLGDVAQRVATLLSVAGSKPAGASNESTNAADQENVEIGNDGDGNTRSREMLMSTHCPVKHK